MDWKKIKTEYITTDTSYRKLCEKYGVSRTTLTKRATREGWVELRSQHSAKREAKMADAVINQQAESAKLLTATATHLLGMIADGLGTFDPDTLLADRQALRGITGALRDLKDVLSLKSDIDLEEQKARIAKLRKESEEETEPPAITVNIIGGDEYAE